MRHEYDQGPFDEVTGEVEISGDTSIRQIKPNPFKNLFTRLLKDAPDVFHRFVNSLPKPTSDADKESIERMRKEVFRRIDLEDQLHSNQPKDPKVN